MSELDFRIVDAFPEPAFSALAEKAFADYEPSALLTSVLDHEAAARSEAVEGAGAGTLRIAVFRSDALVGWTFARLDATNHMHMINSGVAVDERRRGIYSTLVQAVVDHAKSRGCVAVSSRHAASNNAVIVAKLKAGFFVSGFEYSEVYGPLVRLTCLLGELRRALYKSRSSSIRRADPV